MSASFEEDVRASDFSVTPDFAFTKLSEDMSKSVSDFAAAIGTAKAKACSRALLVCLAAAADVPYAYLLFLERMFVYGPSFLRGMAMRKLCSYRDRGHISMGNLDGSYQTESILVHGEEWARVEIRYPGALSLDGKGLNFEALTAGDIRIVTTFTMQGMVATEAIRRRIGAPRASSNKSR